MRGKQWVIKSWADGKYLVGFKTRDEPQWTANVEVAASFKLKRDAIAFAISNKLAEVNVVKRYV